MKATSQLCTRKTGGGVRNYDLSRFCLAKLINIHFSELSQLDSWSYVSHLILSLLPLSQNCTDLSTSRLLRLLPFNFNQVRNLFLLYKCLYKICSYHWIIAKICPATSYTSRYKNSHVSICLIPLCAQ